MALTSFSDKAQVSLPAASTKLFLTIVSTLQSLKGFFYFLFFEKIFVVSLLKMMRILTLFMKLSFQLQTASSTQSSK